MARPPRSFHLQPKSGGFRARVLVPDELQGKIGKKVLCTPVWQVVRGGKAGLAGSAEVRGDDRKRQNRQIRPRRREGGTGAATASRADVQDSRDTQ